jgi:molecular chaperone HscB
VDETYFTALGVPEKFKQDFSVLQRHFYELSRTLHPDRFVGENERSRELSLERMSFLNEAYRTLKSPEELRDYILSLHLPKSSEATKGQIPVELAEGWFELQDILTEGDSDQTTIRLGQFERELTDFHNQMNASLKETESLYDAAANGAREAILKKLSQDIQKASYLTSMKRDVERIKSRFVK